MSFDELSVNAAEQAPVDADAMLDMPIAQVDAVQAVEELEAVAEAAPNGFIPFGLIEPLLQAVVDMGYTMPTPVQEATLSRLLSADGARDLMVSAQTGSGKTAAFLLPVLQHASASVAAGPKPVHPKRMNPRDRFQACRPYALVLCPTRELAQQVAKEAIGLVRHLRGVRVACVMGGMPYALQREQLLNASIVVATPGRLLDLQRSQAIDLSSVKSFVIDEADRMLDLGFAEDLAEIHQLTAERDRTLMFSATFAPRIMSLGERITRNPERVELTSTTDQHQNIEQRLYWADHPMHQRALLDHWLRDASIAQAIVFAETQVQCDELAQQLFDEGHEAAALHGAMSQALRNRRLMALRQGRIRILVATDVAARGIDVPTISHVFNFGLPMKAEDYTHRIGRTGRAGRQGMAVTIAQHRSRGRIRAIEDFTGKRFNAQVIPGLEPKVVERPSGPKFGRGGKPGGGKPFGGPRQGGFGGGFGGGGFGDRRDDRGGFGGDRGGDRGGFAAPRQEQQFAPQPRNFDPRFEQRADARFDNRPPREDRFGAGAPNAFANKAPGKTFNKAPGQGFGAPQDRGGFAGKPFGKPSGPRPAFGGGNAGGGFGAGQARGKPSGGGSFSAPRAPRSKGFSQ